MNKKFLEVEENIRLMQSVFNSNNHRVTILMCEKIVRDSLFCLNENDDAVVARALKRNNFRSAITKLQDVLGDSKELSELVDYLKDFESFVKQVRFSTKDKSISVSVACLSVDTVYKVITAVSLLLKEKIEFTRTYPDGVSAESVAEIWKGHCTIENKEENKVSENLKVTISPVMGHSFDRQSVQVLASTECVPEATGGIKKVAGERLEKEEFTGDEIKVAKGFEQIELNEDIDCEDFVEPVVMSEPKKEVAVERESKNCLDAISSFKRDSGVVRFAMTPAGNFSN